MPINLHTPDDNKHRIRAYKQMPISNLRVPSLIHLETQVSTHLWASDPISEQVIQAHFWAIDPISDFLASISHIYRP